MGAGHSISFHDFSDLILQFANAAGVTIDDKQTQLLSRHIQMMIEWNLRLNLTRITEPEEMIIKHLLDSIAPSKFLPSSGRALDVGTGAGFPGIPLCIVHPGLQVVLLDSNRKKVSFLKAVAASLGIKDLLAFHGRWQDFAMDKDNADQFQLITIRALRIEPEHITCLAPQILAKGGTLAYWQSTPASSGKENEAFNPADYRYPEMEFEGDRDYLLPRIKNRRSVRLWKKI